MLAILRASDHHQLSAGQASRTVQYLVSEPTSMVYRIILSMTSSMLPMDGETLLIEDKHIYLKVFDLAFRNRIIKITVTITSTPEERANPRENSHYKVICEYTWYWGERRDEHGSFGQICRTLEDGS